MTYSKQQILKSESLYKEFESELKEVSTTEILPSLLNQDIYDIIFYFEYCFDGLNEYDSKIEELIEMSDVELTKKQRERILKISSKYINELKKILKN